MTSKNRIVANAVATVKPVAKNWKRSEDRMRVVKAIDTLVGMYNNFVSGNYLDVDDAEKKAFVVIKDVIAKLHPVADVFGRERK